MLKLELYEVVKGKDLLGKDERDRLIGPVVVKSLLHAEKMMEAYLPFVHEKNALKIVQVEKDADGATWSRTVWSKDGKSSDVSAQAVFEARTPTNTKPRRINSEEKKDLKRKGFKVLRNPKKKDKKWEEGQGTGKPPVTGAAEN